MQENSSGVCVARFLLANSRNCLLFMAVMGLFIYGIIYLLFLYLFQPVVDCHFSTRTHLTTSMMGGNVPLAFCSFGLLRYVASGVNTA